MFPRQTFQSHSNQIYTTITHVEEAEVEQLYVRLTGPVRTNTKKNVLFIIGEWNENLGSLEISGVTGKLMKLAKRTHWS